MASRINKALFCIRARGRKILEINLAGKGLIFVLIIIIIIAVVMFSGNGKVH